MNAAALLRELLRRAEAGEITSVAAAFTYRENGTGTGFSDSDIDNLVPLLGAVAILMHELTVTVDAERHPERDDGEGSGGPIGGLQ